MAAYRQVQIAPSILAADFVRLGEEIRAAEAGGADLFHIDIMDGRFVPNLSMGPEIVQAIRSATRLPLDVHLMIVEPERFISQFVQAGADRISVHLEACPNLFRVLQQIQNLGCKAGVAINPHTPVAMLTEIITMVDQVNVMTVNPGFGGQQFLMSMKSKIAELRAMVGDVQGNVDIEVDGGIVEVTAPHAVQSGANILIAGSMIFRHPGGVEAGIASLRDTLEREID